MGNLYSYLHLPYIPNRQYKKKQGRPTSYKYLQTIAYTETMRGLNDDIPTLLFYGASLELLKDTCKYIFKLMNGNVGNLLISKEHSCRIHNGKCYRRTMIQIIGLNEKLISLKEFTLLLISRMKFICNCTIKYFRLGTFLNL